MHNDCFGRPFRQHLHRYTPNTLFVLITQFAVAREIDYVFATRREKARDGAGGLNAPTARVFVLWLNVHMRYLAKAAVKPPAAYSTP